MRTSSLANNLMLIEACPRPAWNTPLCQELASQGVHSLLVVDKDTTPYPSGQAGGIWCLVRPFADEARPSPGELQRITDFVTHEQRHGRMVGIWIGYGQSGDAVLRAAMSSPPSIDSRLPSDDPCCCRPWRQGCHGRLVCHAAPVAVAQRVIDAGGLLSKHSLTGLSCDELKRQDGYGDPSDYYDYVCLANGDCVAPDKVCMERQAGRQMSPQECNDAFYPGVRFFFDPLELSQSPQAAFDGI